MNAQQQSATATTAAAALARHASPEEYAAFVRRRRRCPASVNTVLQQRAHFVRAYPDLAAWFRAPLSERLGQLHGERPGRVTCRASSERLVRLNVEAAAAIRAVQAHRRAERGFRDDLTWEVTRRLFVRYGTMLSVSYLFDNALREACAAAGLVSADGLHMVTAHRFRHTVCTQLAERGARLHTIMAVLGHSDPGMSLVYAQLSDRAVLRVDQAVLGPGAAIAGPLAQQLRAGTLPAPAVGWLKANFLKTELELGHCLRLPQERPCEGDRYLTCTKVVTTPAYAPRLCARRRRELELVADAAARGWLREGERHRCTIARIEQLLTELGQPVEEPAAHRRSAMVPLKRLVNHPCSSVAWPRGTARPAPWPTVPPPPGARSSSWTRCLPGRYLPQPSPQSRAGRVRLGPGTWGGHDGQDRRCGTRRAGRVPERGSR